MSTVPVDSSAELDRHWASLGLPFAEPGPSNPDLEWLLIDSVRTYELAYAGKVRLISAWIARFGAAIARHRLGSLVLASPDSAALACRVERLLGYAEALGAPVELRTTFGELLGIPRPRGRGTRSTRSSELLRLYPELAEDARFAAHIRRRQQWDLSQDPWNGQLPPTPWLVHHNPEYLDRVVRKGDLRVSVIETLRRDVPDAVASSESAMARQLTANRGGVRAAIDALVLEGRVVLERRPGNERDCQVRLVDSACGAPLKKPGRSESRSDLTKGAF